MCQFLMAHRATYPLPKSERDSKRSTASTNHLSIAETQSELPNDFADVHTHRVAWSLSPIIVGSLITVGGRLGLVDYRRKEVLHLNPFVVQSTSRPAHESGWLEGVKTFACRQNCKSHKDRRADATHTTANGNAGNSSPLSQDGRLPCTRDVHTVAFTIATVLTQRQRTGCTRGSPPPPRLLPTLCRIVETQRLWSCA